MASIAPAGALVRDRRPAAAAAPPGVCARKARPPLAASCAQRLSASTAPGPDRSSGRKRSSDHPSSRPAKRQRTLRPPIPHAPPRDAVLPVGKPRQAPRPKDAGWIDLDHEDGDDPLMVSEYVNDIFAHMRRLEVRAAPFVPPRHPGRLLTPPAGAFPSKSTLH